MGKVLLVLGLLAPGLSAFSQSCSVSVRSSVPPVRSHLTDFKTRSAGLLAALSALPGKYSIGDIGSAYKWVPFLVKAKQRWWQMVGLNPADPANSPYSSDSGSAIDLAYLDLQNLVDLGLLPRRRLKEWEGRTPGRADFARAREHRKIAVDLAFAAFQSRRLHPLKEEFREFKKSNAYWLKDHALFTVLRNEFGYDFTQWNPRFRDRLFWSLKKYEWEHAEEISRAKFEQFLLHRQWMAFLAYANSMGVSIIGDLPLYVARYSVDVWASPKAFLLDSHKRPVFVSGYPPCSYYKDGQLWGTPVYDWLGLSKTGYAFWINRMRRNLGLYNAIRIDHFLGFHEYYAIGAAEPTARTGQWYPAEGERLFERLKQEFPDAALIAEDLGSTLPPEVTALRKKFGIPGMYIMQFGYGEDPASQYHTPKNFQKEMIVYSESLDMGTPRAWVERSAGLPFSERRGFTKEMMDSDAVVAMQTLQSLLWLGDEARTNIPGTWPGAPEPERQKENWIWSVDENALTSELARELAEITEQSGRW